MTFFAYLRRIFDSLVLEGDKNIQLIGYNMIREDHPSNAKRGGVCIFYKETLGVRVVNLSNLTEYNICEVSIQNNKGYIGVVHRSPSQDVIEFQNFLSNFESILSDTTTNNALFTIILGDFNAISSV